MKSVKMMVVLSLLLVASPAIGGKDDLTKSDKQRIAALEKAARKYSEVVGACGIRFRGSRGQVIREYRMPNKKGIIPYHYFMELTQIVDGWAIYYNYELSTLPSRVRPTIAVRQSSLRGKLGRGSRLFSQAECFGRLKDATMTNVRGFPVRVRRYEAIYP